MNNTSLSKATNQNKKRDNLISLLRKLFQMDQPELDFGLYKIMHAKSIQVNHFLENDLTNEIDRAFGDAEQVNIGNALEAAKNKVIETLGDDAFDQDGNLQSQYANTPVGKAYLQILNQDDNAEFLGDSAQIYDHLFRFFSRYYDNGDFMSRRYHVAENSQRAAPYAVPYDGREVYLHLANKDQYYIKSSENFRNYTFNLSEAVKQHSSKDSLDFDEEGTTSRKVHFQLVAADEGAHNNVKDTQSKFFILKDKDPVALNDKNELVIYFEYRVDLEKSKQDRLWQELKLAEAESTILDILRKKTSLKIWYLDLSIPAPTEKNTKRTLLAKYLMQYAAKNTKDYFIHKDLNAFLSRELDFYIKNEIMRLDDFEQADVIAVSSWLNKVKVLREVAKQIITFLSQIEEFQKKLWLKKKFVTATNYCITLDRIPESFYEEIASNKAQIAEWINLFAIDEIQIAPKGSKFTKKPNVNFLKENNKLVVDTAYFDENFKDRLIASIHNFDEQCDGLLIHSENYQGLNLLAERHEKNIKSIYIDPPYNANSSEIMYKNTYKHSSWLSLMYDRLLAGKLLLKKDGTQVIAIDEIEQERLGQIIDQVFPGWVKACISIVHNPRGQQGKNISYVHEFAYFIYPTDAKKCISDVKRAEVDSRTLRDSGTESDRTDAKNCFYPIIVKDFKIIDIGEIPSDDFHPKSGNVKRKDGSIEIWPINDSGEEKKWRYAVSSVKNILHKLEVKEGRSSLQIIFNKDTGTMRSLWAEPKYDASEYGTKVLQSILGAETAANFSYPKSIHTVKDTLLAQYDGNNSEIVLDYFAGSGTTGNAVISLNREKNTQLKYILIEMGEYFDTVLQPRIKKIIYSEQWKDGKPKNPETGVSHCFKYIRLESYEDTLNNLQLTEPAARAKLSNEYLLQYMLQTETVGSPSLLNIEQFKDPANYTLKIKVPNSDEQIEQEVDLIETFNWLIGLNVQNIDIWRSYNCKFEREHDPELPNDQNTRLKIKGKLKELDAYSDEAGDYQIRFIEGTVHQTTASNSATDKVLIIWRTLTDDIEKDSAVLESILNRKKVNQADSEYDLIYINGSHGLQMHAQAKSRLLSIEETFMTKMWEGC